MYEACAMSSVSVSRRINFRFRSAKFSWASRQSFLASGNCCRRRLSIFAYFTCESRWIRTHATQTDRIARNLRVRIIFAILCVVYHVRTSDTRRIRICEWAHVFLWQNGFSVCLCWCAGALACVCVSVLVVILLLLSSLALLSWSTTSLKTNVKCAPWHRIARARNRSASDKTFLM